MSQSVPQIYTQVKEFIYASLKFSESLHRRLVLLSSNYMISFQYVQVDTTTLGHIFKLTDCCCHCCAIVCVSSSTEIDDMLRKSTNLLLTRTLSSCLQNLIKKPHIGLTEVGTMLYLSNTHHLDQESVTKSQTCNLI